MSSLRSKSANSNLGFKWVSTMSEKDLVISLAESTTEIRGWFSRINPFMLPKESRQQYQPLVDSVNKVAADARVALRNYDKVMQERDAHIKRIAELEATVDSLRQQLNATTTEYFGVAAE